MTAADTHDQLEGFLRADPDNLALLADTANAAFEARRYDRATELLDHYATLAALLPAHINLLGLIAMAREDWTAAIAIFESLQRLPADAPTVRFNLAWALAMTQRKDAALVLLDDAVVDSIPQAAQLLIGLLHERGELETAIRYARSAILRFPDHHGLNATVSTLAIDIQDLALAETTAARAGDHPDALVTRATLALGDDLAEEAGRLFDTALATNPKLPRAWVGRGLVALASDDPARAAADLDKGAELFGTHLGSWIAAGWAHFLAGDIAAAQARFETALGVDDTFAEAHGSLAMTSLAQGDVAGARQSAERALRLDRDSFSGALAAALLAAGAGDAGKAERIVALALSTPVDGAGRTIGTALAKLGAKLGARG